jgi:hypothetical protein
MTVEKKKRGRPKKEIARIIETPENIVSDEQDLTDILNNLSKQNDFEIEKTDEVKADGLPIENEISNIDNDNKNDDDKGDEINEAFTESFATIINIFYIHIINKMEKKELNIMFQNEIIYSNYICNKIINFYNINNISDIIKKNNECINNFPQKTNVFSYYILKNILLTNHILFSEILNIYTLNYKIIDERCIIKIINLIINNINSFDNKKFSIKDNNKSLRLCLYELKIN